MYLCRHRLIINDKVLGHIMGITRILMPAMNSPSLARPLQLVDIPQPQKYHMLGHLIPSDDHRVVTLSSDPSCITVNLYNAIAHHMVSR